jgi:hypothetical protein
MQIDSSRLTTTSVSPFDTSNKSVTTLKGALIQDEWSDRSMRSPSRTNLANRALYVPLTRHRIESVGSRALRPNPRSSRLSTERSGRRFFGSNMFGCHQLLNCPSGRMTKR